MQAKPSGHCLHRVSTIAALKMLDEMSDEDLGILSDDDSFYSEGRHKSCSSSNSDSDTDLDQDDFTSKKRALRSKVSWKAKGSVTWAQVNVRRKFLFHVDDYISTTSKLDDMSMKWYMDSDNSHLLVAFLDKKAEKNCVAFTNVGDFATQVICNRRGEIIKPVCTNDYNNHMNFMDKKLSLVYSCEA
ncbi:hypothetical protein PoB_001738600 [Plakobranchus ocellatus]|uniref:PiggyBac transposable element-derived protein domain-containing protein n=1 Tax=Plakobranchus ocellatus TaxID=259542 RepID=A0AAV3Z8C2_9GAST|nr:hypothetical protein PoB_001738600 [Plakobranchus ocellatus]